MSNFDCLISNIIDHLPRFSEEGGAFSCVEKKILHQEMTRNLHIANPEKFAQEFLNIIEYLFDTLSLLDRVELSKGFWKFVSYPAQLFALSLLHSLADPKQRLFPPDFWQVAGVSDDVKQKQKAVLKAVEDRRLDHRLDGSLPPPIRFIYVAWGIIKLNGKILFHRREAREHANEYGLVGGRSNLQDLKEVMGETTPIDCLLETLQSPDSKPMFDAMEHTLIREFEEETHLIKSEGHYTAVPWRDLKPYSQCMGAAPNYAFTQYFFRLYLIELTTKGYFALRQAVEKSSGYLIECSIPEVVSGKTMDGGKEFSIEAIYRDFLDDRLALEKALDDLPSSYKNNYRYNFANKKYYHAARDEGFIFSLNNDLLKGKSGQEKSILINLDIEDKKLLLALAGHARSWKLSQAEDGLLTCHDFGWIEFHDAEKREQLSQLAEKLRSANEPLIEVSDARYFRLSIAPELIFLDRAWFEYSISADTPQGKPKITIRRLPIDTPIGLLQGDQKTREIECSLAKDLQKVAAAELMAPEKDSLTRSIRSALQSTYQSLGLRLLLVTQEKLYTLSCRLA